MKTLAVFTLIALIVSLTITISLEIKQPAAAIISFLCGALGGAWARIWDGGAK